ncbi:phosphotransferase family protein [Nocardioides albidus]|uniref:Phosphotransferase family protein n=1 Tax=Nocardioides albidus TaxID=1517589 RepID=A0A5C4VSG5_9ACTN|nr:phosphotransferase family protein [Nocardioides albidus]TNM38475.1 phosphotransferase family protein [Nocardioides albidus]
MSDRPGPEPECRDVQGVDHARLHAWLVENGLTDGRTDASGLTSRLLAGGRSNLTYEISDGSHTWVLRRPPLGHVLETAHDMGREYRVLEALRGSAVPVPQAIRLCSTAEVLGAPFYLMSLVDGVALRTAAEMEERGPERTRAISLGVVDTLVALHAVVPSEVGLGDFGRPEGYLERQVRRWQKQLDSSLSRPLPAAAVLHQRLLRRVPVQSAPGIVHGDYRLDNVLVDDQDRIAAVLDWEMATLGDPLMDLAVMAVYGRLGQEYTSPVISDVVNARGHVSEAEALERYAAGSGRDLTNLSFHLGLAAFKLAVILEGIHFRYVHGQTVGDGFEHIGAAVEPLLQLGLDAMEE